MPLAVDYAHLEMSSKVRTQFSRCKAFSFLAAELHHLPSTYGIVSLPDLIPRNLEFRYALRFTTYAEAHNVALMRVDHTGICIAVVFGIPRFRIAR